MGDPLAGGHRAVLFSVFPASVLLFHPAGRKFLFRLLFVVLTWNRNSRRLVFRSTALLLHCRFLIRILLGTFRLILLPGYGRAVIFCCAYPCRKRPASCRNGRCDQQCCDFLFCHLFFLLLSRHLVNLIYFLCAQLADAG